MSDLALILDYSAQVLLIGLGVLSLVRWRREHDLANAWSGGAAALIGLAGLFEQVSRAAGMWSFTGEVVTIGVVASGYCLMVYRHTRLPLSRITFAILTLISAAVVVAIALVGLPEDEATPRTAAQANTELALLLLWVGLTLEPVIKFWRAARKRPVIQRARARALSVGYGSMLMILLFSIVTNPEGKNPDATVISDVVVFGVVALLFVSFSPPRLVRRIWREREARELLDTAPLFVSVDREEAADKALLRAVRLSGADAGYITDSKARFLALQGLTTEDAAALRGRFRAEDAPHMLLQGSPARQALRTPIPLETGEGSLVLCAGAFTPDFHTEEREYVRHLATITALAIDHAALGELRGEFFDALSHELRTPLTMISGVAQTLMRPDSERMTPELRSQLLARLSANTEELRGKLEELLEFDRASRGVHTPERETVDFSSKTDEVLQRLGIRRARQVDVDVQIASAQVDPQTFDRVLESLLLNVVKHTPDASHVWLRLTHENETILIVVEDDGPGVPVEVRDRIFEPFHRGPNAPAHSPGTAVALALVRRLAVLHGGRAWVEERPGGGASFRVTLSTTPSTTIPASANA